MKSIYKLIIATLVVILILPACEGDLAEMNVNPNASPDLPYEIQLTKVEVNIGGPRYVMGPATTNQGAMIQQVASISIAGVPGDKYWHPGGNFSEPYNFYYSSTVKDIIDLVERTAEDPDDSNFHNIARILKVFIFHRITDQYGDIPYSESGRAHLDVNYFPVFDTQQSIYADMIAELKEATAALNPSKLTYSAGENLYGGDLAKWEKFGYSLMLRLGMRMQKVDAAAAESAVKAAVAGGVFTSNADNMVVKHDAAGNEGNWNGFTRWNQDNFNSVRISKTLVDELVNTGDPRLSIFAQSFDDTSTLQGLPNGYDATTIQGYSGGEDLSVYAWFNKNLANGLGNPSIQLTYSEVSLLQAEAVLRGWITGDATALYEAGVEAGMTQWDVFSGITVPDANAIATYLTNNPFDNSYEMLGEQMWLTHYLNWYEGWSNWRRSGFPVLTPVNYTGNETGGTIPRRLWYGILESQLNVDNYKTAIARQGADNYTTRIWWDK